MIESSQVPNTMQDGFKAFKINFLHAVNTGRYYELIDGIDFFTLGIIYYFYDKDYFKAKNAFHQALEKGYSKEEEIYARLGACYFKLEKPDEAEARRYLGKAMAANYAPGYYNLGLFYKKIKDYKNAAKAFKQAFIIKENYHLARNNYGTTLKEMGKYQLSISVLEKLIEMKENYYLAHYNLACSLCLYVEQGVITDDEIVRKVVNKILKHLAEAFKDVNNVFEAKEDKDLVYINSYVSNYYPEFDSLCTICTKKYLNKK